MRGREGGEGGGAFECSSPLRERLGGGAFEWPSAKMVSNYFIELKREAAARGEVREKFKEEESPANNEVKESAGQESKETPSQAPDIKQEQ